MLAFEAEDGETVILEVCINSWGGFLRPQIKTIPSNILGDV